MNTKRYSVKVNSVSVPLAGRYWQLIIHDNWKKIDVDSVQAETYFEAQAQASRCIKSRIRNSYDEHVSWYKNGELSNERSTGFNDCSH